VSSAPFTAYSFAIEVRLPGRDEPLCEAAFCACDGLELRRATVTYRDGGESGAVHLVAGQESVGTVTLRRGMTDAFDLWDWWERVRRDPRLRATCDIVVLSPDLERERVRFRLHGCLPVKIVGPDFDARASDVAIESLELDCERIELVRPGEPTTPMPTYAEPAHVQLRELDERFEREINDDRWLTAQFHPEGLRTSLGIEQGSRARLELRLSFDLDAPLPPGCDADGDVRRLTERAHYLATPRRALDGTLTLPAVRLAWGTFAFDGHIEALEESLERFSADGRALRATLALALAGPLVAAWQA
jgi:phage tail-like protein